MNYVKERVNGFLAKYGEKGFLVLKTALEVAEDPYIDHRLGDFDYKRLYLKLLKTGVKYAPQNLLRILEKEYEVIERTYSSSNQKWWRFLDIFAVKEALEEYMGLPSVNDPKLALIKIKYRSLDPINLLQNLKRLLFKDKLSNVDKEFFQKFAFETLEKVVSILNEMQEYEQNFVEEINVLNEILRLADAVSLKVAGLKKSVEPLSEDEENVKSEAPNYIKVRNSDSMDNE